MILYDYILSPECYAVRLTAALAGVRLNTVAVDFHPGAEQKTPAFRRINPAGTIPVLVDGPVTLTEPAAIVTHLAPPAMRGSGPMVAEWLARSAHFSRTLGGARLHDMVLVPGDIDALRGEGEIWLRILEETLSEGRIIGRAFLTGDAVSIADLAVFPHVALAPDGGISLDSYPAIRLWMRAIRSLPGFIEMPGIHRMHDLAPEPGPEIGGEAVA